MTVTQTERTHNGLTYDQASDQYYTADDVLTSLNNALDYIPMLNLPYALESVDQAILAIKEHKNNMRHTMDIIAGLEDMDNKTGIPFADY